MCSDYSDCTVIILNYLFCFEGVIEGGHSLDQRMRCLDILLENKDEIGGFILDGIETNGPSLEDRDIDSIRTIVEGVTVSGFSYVY